MRYPSLLLVGMLAGCAAPGPAPVSDIPKPVRIEAPGPAAAAKPPASTAEKFYTIKKGDTLYSIALDHGVEYKDLAAWNSIGDPSRIKVGQQLRVAPPGVEALPAAPAGSAVVQPIAIGGPVAVRSLDGAAAPQPLPAVAVDEKIKTMPKGGKLPYSEANLAMLKNRDAMPAAAAASSVPPAVEKTEPPPPAPAPASAPAAVSGDVDWAWPAPGKVIAGFSEGGNGAEATKGIDIAGKVGDPVLAAATGKVVYVGSGLRGYGNLVIVRHTPVYLSAYAHNSRILVKEGQQVTRGQKIAELGDSDADRPKLHFEVRQQGKPVDPMKYLPPR
jgi:lipoprotein NlpD